jgi:hypothetical protein
MPALFTCGHPRMHAAGEAAGIPWPATIFFLKKRRIEITILM